MTDREKLVELLTEYYGADPAYYDVDAPSIADHLISNGVVVRKKGEWSRTDRNGNFDYYYAHCTKCGYEIGTSGWSWEWKHNFCPNCGADMRKGENG